MTQILSWSDAARRINELLESGEFATNVELLEAQDYERDRVSESLWYLYHDLSEEGKAHTVYLNHEEYKVRKLFKNQITGRNDLWLDPARQGNHQIPIVAFTDNEDLLRQVSLERPEFIIGDEVRYEVIKTEPSEEQKEILKSLSERADDVRNRVVEPDEDNIGYFLCRVYRSDNGFGGSFSC